MMADPVGDFARLRAEVAATDDRDRQQALVDAFVSAHPVSPLVSADRAIIYYTGSAASALLRGDMLDERSERLYAQPAHLIIGTYETAIGAPDRGDAEADFLRANREFRDLLDAQRYRYAYAEYHEGHSWGLWRVRLGDALAFLLNP
ncbi:MAG TPA: alpha/beta hydrolase-fold protein [Herpetosiphonaceae bacterium]